MNRYNLLISLLDSHNEASILATAKYIPQKVLFIYENKSGKEDQVNKLRDYYQKRFNNIEFLSVGINELEDDVIEDVLKGCNKENTIVNLSGGNKINTLFLFSISQKYNLKNIYLDVEKEYLITIENLKITIEKDSFVDLNIEDVIENIGGSIILESTESSNYKTIEKLTDLIANNQKIWQKVKYRIYDNLVIEHDDSNPVMINLNFKPLDDFEKKVFNKVLDLLKKYNEIEYKDIEKNCIRIRFLNSEIKSFIFKTGTWLEIFTKKIVEEIDSIDDVKNGVVFFWNDDKRKIKNELDVVAIKDSVLICISCKDSEKYDEVALNELNVYAEQLGGEKVIKVLVTTKPPIKSSVFQRAEEMSINLIIYEGNREDFQNKIKDAIYKMQ